MSIADSSDVDHGFRRSRSLDGRSAAKGVTALWSKRLEESAMPAKRIEMRRIRDIMRLHEEGMSNRSIGLVVGVSPATVCDLLGRVVAAGLMWPLPDGLDDGQLEARLYPPDPSARGALVTPDWSYIHRELRRKHVTLMLLWQEYKADHPEDGYQYSHFCESYKRFTKYLDVSMRQVHLAGEKAFVD